LSPPAGEGQVVTVETADRAFRLHAAFALRAWVVLLLCCRRAHACGATSRATRIDTATLSICNDEGKRDSVLPKKSFANIWMYRPDIALAN